MVEALPVILLAPFAGLLAAALAALLKWLRLLPSGVPAVLAGVLLWSVLMGGFFVQNYLDEMILRPWRYQAEHLGKQYGTPFNLKRYQAFGFQDWTFEWTYRLTPAQVAELRARCGAPTESMGHKGCRLYSQQTLKGGAIEASMEIVLTEGQLYIVETA